MPAYDNEETQPATCTPVGESDVDAAMRFLMWARKNGFAVPELTVGQVAFRVRDLNPRNWGGGATVDERDIWEQYGATEKE